MRGQREMQLLPRLNACGRAVLCPCAEQQSCRISGRADYWKGLVDHSQPSYGRGRRLNSAQVAVQTIAASELSPLSESLFFDAHGDIDDTLRTGVSCDRMHEAKG